MISCRFQISNKYYYYYYYYTKSWIILKKPKKHSISCRLYFRFKVKKMCSLNVVATPTFNNTQSRIKRICPAALCCCWGSAPFATCRRPGRRCWWHGAHLHCQLCSPRRRRCGSAARSTPTGCPGRGAQTSGSVGSAKHCLRCGWRQLDEATWLCEPPPKPSTAIKDNVRAAYTHRFVFCLQGEKGSLTMVLW